MTYDPRHIHGKNEVSFDDDVILKSATGVKAFMTLTAPGKGKPHKQESVTKYKQTFGAAWDQLQ